jgi:hypothetical protein
MESPVFLEILKMGEEHGERSLRRPSRTWWMCWGPEVSADQKAGAVDPRFSHHGTFAKGGEGIPLV